MRRLMGHIVAMTQGQFLKTRVSTELKQSVQLAAQQRHLTESIWLRQVLLEALQHQPLQATTTIPKSRSGNRRSRLSVRLRSDDSKLLDARAAARALAPATYVSLLVRTHLQGVAPIPAEELKCFRDSIRELTAVRRYLQALVQIAVTAGRVTGLSSKELGAVIRVLTDQHDRMKSLLAANLKSWETGNGGE